MKGAFSFLRRRLLAGLSVIVLFAIAAAIFSLGESRRHHESGAVVVTRNMAWALSAQIEESLVKIDNLLLAVVDEYQRQDRQGKIDEHGLNTFVERMRSRLPEVDAFRITNAEGELVIGTGVARSAGISLADQPHFIRLRDDAKAGLVFSKPQVSRVNNRRVIVLARRLAGPDGTFQGMAFAALKLEHLTRLFSVLDVGAGGVVGLRDAESYLVARYPESAQVPLDRKDVLPEEMRRWAEAGQTSATVADVHFPDNIVRVASFRRLGQFPFYLFVGMARDDVLAEWRRELQVTILVVVVFFSALFLMTGRMLSVMRRNDLAQAALKEEEAKFHCLFEAANDGIFLQDARGFVDSNRRGAALYGLSREQIVGRSPSELCPERQPDGRPSAALIEERIQAAFQGQPQQFEWQSMRADGTLFDVEISLSRLEIRGRDFLQSIVRDISERKRTEDGLRRAKDAAEAASRAKSAFLANMSHELRTPMNHIMGLTALALRRASDPKQQDQLEKVDAASKHLLGLINDILDLSKIEAVRLTLERTDFSLGEVVGNVTNIVGHKAEEKGLLFKVELPEALAGRQLRGDPLRLSQILINLAGNAVKFTACGHVVVRAAQVDERPDDIVLRFEVEDSGIGMSAENRKRLFAPFEQADDSMARKYGGTGLGLAISKHLVEMMDGEMGVESELDRGSTFWFTVRMGKNNMVLSEPVAAKGLSAAEQLRARYDSARILVVEDEPVNMMVTRAMLEQVGLHSDPAIDGYEAVVLAQEYRYDLILMDIRMPILDGLDATRSIRADSLNMATPIVAMTANAFEEDRCACLEAGMDDHIGKPVPPEQLYQVMLRWLAERQSSGSGGSGG